MFRTGLLAVGLVCLLAGSPLHGQERVRFEYDGGYFEKTADGTWVEMGKFGNYKYVEVGMNPKLVQIFDKGRKTIVTIFDTMYFVQVDKGAPKPGNKGKWVTAKVDPKDVTKKDDPKVELKGTWTEIAPAKGPTKVNVPDLAISPDGKFCAMQMGSPATPEYGIVELATSKVPRKFKGMSNRLIWSADGASLAVAVMGEIKKDIVSSVIIWDTKTWEPRATFEMPGIPSGFDFSGDGQTVAAVSSGDASGGNLIVWDVPSKKQILTLKPKGGTPRLALSRDGKLLVASGSGGELAREAVVFEIPTGKMRSSVTALYNFVFAPDGKTLIEYNPIDGGMQLSVYDVSGGPGKTLRTIKTPGFRADTATLLDDGRYIALGGGLSIDEVRIYSLISGELVKTLPASRLKGPGRTTCIVRATADSSHLVAFGTDKDIRVWTTPFGK